MVDFTNLVKPYSIESFMDTFDIAILFIAHLTSLVSILKSSCSRNCYTPSAVASYHVYFVFCRNVIYAGHSL